MSIYQNYANSGYNAYAYNPRPMYNGFQQPMSPFMQPQAQQPMQPPIQQPMQAQQPSATPINEVRFVTSDEAKGFMVLPYQNALLIDTQNKTAWLKMADGIGQSTTKLYKYAETEQAQTNNAQGTQPQVDLSAFVKKEELNAFATKQDIQSVVQALDNLQRRLQINEIEKGGKTNGRENAK